MWFCTKAWGEEPQPKWVHIFFHTLDVVPHNWYLETELHRRNVDWAGLIEGFLLTFSFEYVWDCIDDGLHDVRIGIFWIPNEPSTWE